MENIVSIWIGDFESEEKFITFTQEQYDEEGDCRPSLFMEAFEIDDLDHDFQEILFQENLSKNDIEQASYAESFIDKINDNSLKGNCIILLYDFNYKGKVQTNNGLHFLGTFKYEKT